MREEEQEREIFLLLSFFNRFSLVDFQPMHCTEQFLNLNWRKPNRLLLMWMQCTSSGSFKASSILGVFSGRAECKMERSNFGNERAFCKTMQTVLEKRRVGQKSPKVWSFSIYRVYSRIVLGVAPFHYANINVKMAMFLKTMQTVVQDHMYFLAKQCRKLL